LVQNKLKITNFQWSERRKCNCGEWWHWMVGHPSKSGNGWCCCHLYASFLYGCLFKNYLSVTSTLKKGTSSSRFLYFDMLLYPEGDTMDVDHLYVSRFTSL